MEKSRIVKVLVASALLTLSLAATSFAAIGDKEVDVNVGFDTETASGIGSGFGGSIGGGLEMIDVSAVKGGTLQVRGDIGYNKWSKGPLKYTRIPVSVGARLYVPMADKLRVYGEGSLELSIDKAEVAFLGSTASASENHFGISPAAGVEFAVTPTINVGASVKYHIITDGYLSASVGVGFKF